MMKIKPGIFGSALTLSIFLALLVVGVALAITIVVDGDEEAVWTTGIPGQLPGHVTDPDESSITDQGRDISDLYWTNDTTYFYFLIRTQGIPSLDEFTWIMICIDNDNSTGTGSSFSNCNNMSGIDRYIYVYGTMVEEEPNEWVLVLSVLVQDQYWHTIASGSIGYNPFAANPVIEISAPNSSLGLTSTNCLANMPAVVYFDGGTGDPDDNLPGSATISIGCNHTTDITLTNLTAQSSYKSTVLLLVSIIVGFVAVGSFIRFRSARTQGRDE